jgi:sporulation protein YlmC with PRC-barrel domain
VRPSTASALAVAALALALTAPASHAQTRGSRARLENAALTTQDGELRASKMLGSTVYDVQNRNIGSVKDIVLDRNGRVAAVVVDVGAFLGIGGKDVAVPLGDLKTDHDRLTLNRTKEQLQAAEAYPLATQR